MEIWRTVVTQPKSYDFIFQKYEVFDLPQESLDNKERDKSKLPLHDAPTIPKWYH